MQCHGEAIVSFFFPVPTVDLASRNQAFAEGREWPKVAYRQCTRPEEVRHDDVTRATRVLEFNQLQLSQHLCATVCHLVVMLFACFARTAWSECMNGFVKDKSSRWLHSQCFRGYERAVSDGKLYACISSLHRWAFSGPRRSNDSKPSQEY